jgi:hypothetical protein
VTSAGTATRERVRRIVADDLRPVRPLFPPSYRVLVVLPIALLVAYAAATRYGRRDDFDHLGLVLTWGFSALQWTLGLLVLGAALRLAVPGSGTSRRALWMLCGATVAAILAITGVTYAANQTFVPSARFWMFSYLCFVGPLQIAAPLLVAAVLLAARAYPTRPAAVGALCGVAAGVVADSGWRLTCWITAPTHVLGTHILAVVTMAIVGAVLGVAIDRARAPRRYS